MQHSITLVSDPAVHRLDDDLLAGLAGALAAAGATVGPADWLSPGRAVDLAVSGAAADAVAAVLDDALGDRPVDRAVLPRAGRRKKLLISDMDSTIVDNETLDDLADLAGVGEAVAEITWQSMRGEVDFVEAIEKRVAMLEGLPAAMLEAAFERVRLMPGATALVRTMAAHGAHAVLVSGGFTYFTSRVMQLVGFHAHEANRLEIAHGRLTGRIVPPIINRDGKVNALKRISAAHGIAIAETLAVGDGANDMGMIAHAGLGIAYRGKPVVAQAAAVRVDHTDLRTLLYVQGYRDADIAA